MHVESVMGHSHEDSHPQSHEQSPRSLCDCIGAEETVLVSSVVPEPVKHRSADSLATEPFSTIPLPSFPSVDGINVNHHGPPQSVSAYLKNQALLI